jgi:hypothetical protein
MATVPEECANKEQRSVAQFFLGWGAKGLGANNIHKEMFPVYSGRCLLHKAVHNWVKKFSQ